MLTRLRNRRAMAMMEYLAVFVLIFLALIVMSSYIKNALQGRMKSAGETFSFGRQ